MKLDVFNCDNELIISVYCKNLNISEYKDKIEIEFDHERDKIHYDLTFKKEDNNIINTINKQLNRLIIHSPKK